MGRGRGRGGMQPMEPGERMPGGPLVACCLCLFACALLGAVLTYFVWCIIAVSNNGRLQDSKCAHVANIWWTVMIMLIIQAVNLCVLPCIFGWENYKMQQDPEYARTMRMPMTVLHLLILCGEALFVCIFGLLTWMGVDTKCREKEVPTDLWVLFQITVVLWTISAACTACGACAVCCMLCGILPEPEGGFGAQQQGGHQAQPGEREDDPFVEQNPGGHPDV